MSREDLILEIRQLLKRLDDPLARVWVTFEHDLKSDDVTVINQYTGVKFLGVGNLSFTKE